MIKKNKKHILVTGGTGFIGRFLVKRLVEDGHRVRVLDNNWRGAEEKLGETLRRVEFIEADIRDGAAVEKACRGIDMVCHLAYINGTEFFYTMPDLVLDVGVTGMMNVVKGAIKNKVPELVVASSSEVYQNPPRIPTDESAPFSIPDPFNPRYSYAGGKILSELITINFGRKYFKRAIVFRPHNVFGPDMGEEHVFPQFIERIMKMSAKKKSGPLPFPIQGRGDQTRAFIYINDFIDGLMKVIDRGKHLNIYHIGNSKEITVKALAQMIGREFNRDIKIVPSRALQIRGGPFRRCPDISKLKRLGFKPRIPLAVGLKETVEWYRGYFEKEQDR